MISAVSYDEAGNQRFVTDGNGVITEYTYDVLNRLTETELTVMDCYDNPILHTTAYGYDANGNQTSQTDWLGNTYTYVYDPLNRLIEKTDPFDITIESLEYNNNGAQIKSYDAYDNLTQYTYDKNNRILTTVDPLSHTVSQTYDDAGNIATKTNVITILPLTAMTNSTG